MLPEDCGNCQFNPQKLEITDNFPLVQMHPFTGSLIDTSLLLHPAITTPEKGRYRGLLQVQQRQASAIVSAMAVCLEMEEVYSEVASWDFTEILNKHQLQGKSVSYEDGPAYEACIFLSLLKAFEADTAEQTSALIVQAACCLFNMVLRNRSQEQPQGNVQSVSQTVVDDKTKPQTSESIELPKINELATLIYLYRIAKRWVNLEAVQHDPALLKSWTTSSTCDELEYIKPSVEGEEKLLIVLDQAKSKPETTFEVIRDGLIKYQVQMNLNTPAAARLKIARVNRMLSKLKGFDEASHDYFEQLNDTDFRKFSPGDSAAKLLGKTCHMFERKSFDRPSQEVPKWFTVFHKCNYTEQTTPNYGLNFYGQKTSEIISYNYNNYSCTLGVTVDINCTTPTDVVGYFAERMRNLLQIRGQGDLLGKRYPQLPKDSDICNDLTAKGNLQTETVSKQSIRRLIWGSIDLQNSLSELSGIMNLDKLLQAAGLDPWKFGEFFNYRIPPKPEVFDITQYEEKFSNQVSLVGSKEAEVLKVLDAKYVFFDLSSYFHMKNRAMAELMIHNSTGTKTHGYSLKLVAMAESGDHMAVIPESRTVFLDPAVDSTDIYGSKISNRLILDKIKWLLYRRNASIA